MNVQEHGAELYLQARTWLKGEWERVDAGLAGKVEELYGKSILVTGAAGFLGFNFLNYFSSLNDSVPDRLKVRVLAVDNFLRGKPKWLVELAARDANITVRQVDIVRKWESSDSMFDYIIHGASVASPTFYRKYPLETLDANIIGLRNMLDLGRRIKTKSLLYFSSSEIYGDPPAEAIPTKESYRGNVACIGPRACYDESKRVGETLCYLYHQQFGTPAKIVRPFNNYGLGLPLTDGRVVPDLCRDALAGQDLVLRSDGKPARTFCYSTDALTGYLLVLLSDHNADPFNIGTATPEISMHELASAILDIVGSGKRVEFEPSKEAAYLTDNPQRRCPDISKATTLLGYEPRVPINTGLTSTLKWYRRFSELSEAVKTV